MGDAVKTEVVSGGYSMEAGSEDLGVKRVVELEESMSLPADTPVLPQMDTSQLLNNSDYGDDSSDEDPETKFREHETEGEDSSSDEESSDEEAEGAANMVTNAEEDTQHSGHQTDNRSYQAANSWHRTIFKQTKPDVQYPASHLNNTSSTDISKYFNEYIDDEIFDRIVRSTNQTVFLETGKPLDFTKDECKILFGIIITMSCINYPDIQMYWNRKWAIELIVKAMSQERFMQLWHSLKLVFDDDIIKDIRASDHLWKVRPIINRVLEGCHRQKRHQDLAIQELIIPLQEKYPITKYCPDKPNPTGIKILVLANPNGLICDFVAYLGENNSAEEMILHLTRTVIPGHILYFNRYLTTIELATELYRNGIKCVGALMKSRMPKEAKSELQSDKALVREGQGSHDFLVSSDGEMAITKWFDNKPMLYLSTVYAVGTPSNCIRYDRKGRRLRVPRPVVAKEYESNMGAISIIEKLLAAWPTKMKTSKWTLRFMLHFIDLAICNSWIQYMQSKKVSIHKTSKLWEFKGHIGKYLIESNLDSDGTLMLERNETDGTSEFAVSKRGRSPVASIPLKMMRTRGEHLPQMLSVNRCRNIGCNKKTMVSCITCKVNLCCARNRNCFKEFHTDMSS